MTRTSLRSTLALLVLATASTLPLSGCFPLMAGGAAVTASVASDRRTTGAIVDDEAIEWKVGDKIARQLGDRVHINVTSYNRIVLLTGEAPREEDRALAEQLARETENVRDVVNEIQIASPSSLGSRASDSSITAQVKARFVNQSNGAFAANHVKVVTENGVVYLMGLVTRREADAATHIARTTSGVRKVVRVFEYIPEEEARRLDRQGAEPKGTSKNSSTTGP
ncbi:BON domain-containing protein [Tepidiphilus margaritifer]|uniref:BON domain-containing protein n=1 Tax=Tepidiphilus margaritifer TaxID=203471 RepID=UPI000421955A|nr:BON domain-containing protein [Tepidiphilus margaritifer]